MTRTVRCSDPNCFEKHGYHCHCCGEGFLTMSLVCSHVKECPENPNILTIC